MQALGPFEPAPRLAVGVSGGADSMALALLLHNWVRAKGGALTALTVDHGLRPGSAEEAAEAGRLLAARGLKHVVLRWDEEGPRSGIQAAARSARLRLLSDWCAREGVLHLALAHHAADQSETLVQRLWSGSGLDGLAAIAPVRELRHCRLLRPLIAIAPERLRATLCAAGMPWLEDPSNDDTRFGRVQARRFLAGRADPLRSRRLAVEACHALGHWRRTMEQGCAELAARACRLHPLGYAELDWQVLHAAPRRLSERLLRGLFRAVGGAAYAISEEEAEAARRWLCEDHRGVSFTAGRCQLLAGQGAGERALLCRERRALPQFTCTGSGPWLWDGRFLLHRKNSTEAISLRLVSGSILPSHVPTSKHPIAVPAAVDAAVLEALPWVLDEGGRPTIADFPGLSTASSLKSPHLAARFCPSEPAVLGPFTVA